MKFPALLLATVLSTAMSTAATAQTLNTTLQADIRTLMPGGSPDLSSGTVRQNIYEGLVGWRNDGSVAPMLAESYSVSADGKTYTFKLRRGVKFHNGAPLTSAEVKWTWDRFLDAKSTWPCRATFNGSSSIKVEAVETPEPLVVRFTLTQPSPTFLSALARADCDSTGIAHPESVNAQGAWINAIGTGPFKLGEWKRNQHIDLLRNADYQSRSEPTDGMVGAKKALVERVHIRVVPDAATNIAALKSGASDLWVELPASVIGELKASKNLTIDVAQLAAVFTAALQVKDPVLADPRVRQAINMAIDRAGMAKSLTDGTAKPSASLVPMTSRHFGAVQKEIPAFDPAAATKLLREGGYRGQPVTILTNKGNETMMQSAIAMQAMLAAIGMNAQVEMLEFATLFERYYAGRYQIAVWFSTPYLDPTFVFERFTGDKSKQADKPWDTPHSRELLARLLATGGDTQQPIFDDLHRLFLKEVPMIVWASRSSISAFGPQVRGFASWPGQKPRFWNISVVR